MRNWINILAETYTYGYATDESGNELHCYELTRPNDLTYALRKTRKNQELRGLVNDDMVIAWDSWHGVHYGVIEDFNSYNEQFDDGEEFEPLVTEWKAMIYLYADYVAMAPKREGDIEYVRNHPILKALYGGTVNIRSARDGSN